MLFNYAINTFRILPQWIPRFCLYVLYFSVNEVGSGGCCGGGMEDGDEWTENFGDEMISESSRGQSGANGSDTTVVVTGSVLMNSDSGRRRCRYRKAAVVSE